MRFRTKAMITAAFAGPAIAALIMTGAGPANAAVTTPAAPTASTWTPVFPYCSQWNLERFDFRGNNVVHAVFDGSNYYYSVHFDQYGSCLGGSLTDSYAPDTGPIHGTVFLNHVTFSFTYTYSGETQGTRVYVGTISQWGVVSGYWYDTGTDHSTGMWSLGYPVRRACPQFYPWLGFFQYGNGCPVPFPYWWYY
jgi:hypothetical protein